jgi:hypothetical protein
LFNNKSIAKRMRRAVDPTLEPGETLRAMVYGRGRGTIETALLGPVALAAVPTYILASTDRRVLIFQGNNFNAARSTLLGAVPREQVTVQASGAKPTQVTVFVAGDEGHTFEIPLVWRQDAARFAADLRAPG